MPRKFYKKNITFIFMILSVIFFVDGAYAATYYVDFSTGSDTNNGTSTSSPFKRCPGDTSATGTAASTTLSAGDTVYFKGGVTYTGSISLNWSGSSGSQIVYEGNSTGAWGTGRAVLTGGSPPGTIQGAFTEASARSYITIKGFEATAYRASDYSAHFYRSVASAHTGVVIENNYIHDLGSWNNTLSTTPNGFGIYTVLCNNCTISNNTITKVGEIGIHLNGNTNGNVTNNVIGQYINWGIDLAGDYGTNDGITISGNTLYDFYLYDTGYWGGGGEPPHTDFIFLRGNSGEGNCPKNVVIDGNLFYNNASLVGNGGTAMIYNGCLGAGTPSNNVSIRNNVFINPHSFATISSATATNWKINNNTFYGGSTAIHVPGTGSEVKNNAVYSDIVIHWNGSFPASGTVIDYNYYCSSNAQPFKGDSPYNQMTFALWKSTYGKDAHSTLTSNCSNMKFNNVSGYPTNSGSMDLSLQSTSPLLNTGTTISSFSTDRLGVSRPKGSAWDIGAYESTFVPGPKIPYPPAIIQVN